MNNPNTSKTDPIGKGVEVIVRAGYHADEHVKDLYEQVARALNLFLFAKLHGFQVQQFKEEDAHYAVEVTGEASSLLPQLGEIVETEADAYYCEVVHFRIDLDDEAEYDRMIDEIADRYTIGGGRLGVIYDIEDTTR